ncbi:unnamed protein product [Rhizophagus irregularis]|nr:unnamed protein product [Rhizophagus irregularis]
MKSAIGGYSKGQCVVGFYYSNGIGTQQDYEKAFEWRLLLFYFGIGAKVNIEEAIVCYKVASDNGIDKAKVRFAELD